ncbi:hypothetical protein F5887DRAFT_960769 [Amanita rubescens]|nr:hypothetical protein F5887DRAFT_960769 [Amanita rubescens]
MRISVLAIVFITISSVYAPPPLRREGALVSEKVHQEPQIPFSTTSMTTEELRKDIEYKLVDGVEDSLQKPPGEGLLTSDANSEVYTIGRGLVHDRAGSAHTSFVVRRIEAVNKDHQHCAFFRIAVLARADKLILWTKSTASTDKLGMYYIVTKLLVSKGHPCLPVPTLNAQSEMRKQFRDHLVTLYGKRDIELGSLQDSDYVYYNSPRNVMLA